MPHRTTALLWRALLAAGLVCAVGLLPWLAHTDPALTVLKARSAERDPDPAVLATIRAQLGLDEGPLRLLTHWLGGLPRGDAGRSWISGTEVMPAVLQALGASLLLMTTALGVAAVTAAAVCMGTLWRGGRAMGPSGGGGGAVRAVLRGGLAQRHSGWSTGSSGGGVRAVLPRGLARRRGNRPAELSGDGGGDGACAVLSIPPRRLTRRSVPRTASHPGGTASAALAALPEFLTASVLATVVGVQLGWLPALGWYGPRWTVLPALALGLPAGAVLGRLLDDLLPGAFAEPWARAAAARGLPGRRIARQAVRRCLPGLLPNLGLFVVGLTGGAVAVEQIFDIPGLGRTTLQAALAQDLPVLQAGTLVLLLLAALAAGLSRLVTRLLVGPAMRAGALPSLHGPAPTPRRALPVVYAALLLGVLALGLPRDPLALNTRLRLQHPTWAHPFGTDALGRDLLARIAHGAVDTLLLALAISTVALVTGILLGLLPRLSGPLVDTVNAVPPVLAALLVTAVAGGGSGTPALAVAALAWTPLATHTSALLRQERATLHVTATRGLGAGRWYLLRHELLPAVLPPVTRHALLRLPGVALALASLGFLGLGTQPPSPEWGLLLAENQPYAERAPWAVLAPAAVLALLGALAVTAAGSVRAAGQGQLAVR
ncbi:ABC transporter permease subunit [Streptomyces sp. MBT62]|uniref:ABC transporter permease subunit n=1 Tax=Streptomyces sp. MBT62 TaxID=2800410 RepID=UPI00190D7108|nr:ABC transporter permease subunit [Streptomyces sp. MBT62]MBK3567581.1 ABC transporter permease subunit [Streptomyces sp. MBT62]